MTEETAARTPGSPESLSDSEMLLLQEIVKSLGRSLDPARTVREMLHLLSELLGLNRGRVLLPDPASGELAIRYAYGLTRTEMERGRYAAGEGITGKVMRTGKPVIIQSIDAEPGYLARAVDRARLPQEPVAYIALPIEIDGRVEGVLGVHRLRDRPRRFADDLRILRIVATLIAQVLRIARLVEERTARLEQENRALKSALEISATPHGIIGESPRLRAALRQVEQVSQSDATVLLLGESGTGKELFARALHLYSPRRDAPFVKVNCGAIPESLFESELFGYEKGAFTGATASRPGRFEQADGGTLFLDEVGDLPLAMQVKLLRVLQERSVERVGGRREIPVDVRIVAATNQDLQRLVAAGRFRLDLFYRLNVIPVRLPPLRERREDIRPLVRHTLNQINQAYQRNVAISADALAALVAYDWPGNIRQLRNILERLALLAEDALIGAGHVAAVLAVESSHNPEALPAPASAPPGPPREAPPPGAVRGYRHVAEDEREGIVRALAACRGNKSRAAQQLGLTLRQLSYRMRVLGIPRG